MSHIRVLSDSPAQSQTITSLLERHGIPYSNRDLTVTTDALTGKVPAELLLRGTVGLDELKAALEQVAGKQSATAISAELQRQKELTLSGFEQAASEISKLLSKLATWMDEGRAPGREELTKLSSRVAGLEKNLSSLGSHALAPAMGNGDFVQIRASVSQLSKAFAGFGESASKLSKSAPAEASSVLVPIQQLSRALLATISAGSMFAPRRELSTFDEQRRWLESQSPDGKLGRFEAVGRAYVWRSFDVPKSDPQHDIKQRLFVLGDQCTGFDDGVASHLGWKPVLADNGDTIGWVTARSARDGSFKAADQMQAAKDALQSKSTWPPSAMAMAAEVVRGSSWGGMVGHEDSVEKWFHFAQSSIVPLFVRDVFQAAGGSGALPEALRKIVERFDPPGPYSSAGEYEAKLERDRRSMGQEIMLHWFGQGRLSKAQMKAVHGYADYVEWSKARMSAQFQAALASLGPDVLAEHLAFRGTPAGDASPASKAVIELLHKLGVEIPTSYADDISAMAKGHIDLAFRSGRYAGKVDGVVLKDKDLRRVVDSVVDAVNTMCPSGTDDRMLRHLWGRYSMLGRAIVDLILDTYRGSYPKQISAATVLAHHGYKPVDSEDGRRPNLTKMGVVISMAANGGEVQRLTADQLDKERLCAIMSSLGDGVIASHNELAQWIREAQLLRNGEGDSKARLEELAQQLASLAIRKEPLRPGDEIRSLLLGELADARLLAKLKGPALEAADALNRTAAERRAFLEKLDRAVSGAIKEGDAGMVAALVHEFSANGVDVPSYWDTFRACTQVTAGLLHS